MRGGLALFKNLIIFVGLSCMIYMFYIQTKNINVAPKKVKPQEYMSNLQTTNYDAQGNPKETLQAEYWEFNPTEGYSDLRKPYLTVYKANGEVWNLSSDKALAWHATINDKVSKVDMLDGVIIERPESANNVPIIVKTPELQYLPDEEKVTTTKFVSMQQPGLIISGVGLRGDLSRNWIELNDKITTIYTPN